MVLLSPSSLIDGPKKTGRWGTALSVDLGCLDVTLAVSRENRLPRASVVVTMAAQEFMRLSKAGEKVDHVVVFGSQCDPTEHPDFRVISENLRELRHKWFPKAKLVLLSDSPRLDTVEVRLGMGTYDIPVIRLEYGTVKSFTALTGRKGTELADMVRHLAGLDRLVVHAVFVRGDIDNSTDSEVRGWIKRLQEVRPREVLLSTPDSKRSKKLRGVTRARLDEILEQVSDKVGTPVAVVEAEELGLG